jgi:hypothetical protein
MEQRRGHGMSQNAFSVDRLQVRDFYVSKVRCRCLYICAGPSRYAG